MVTYKIIYILVLLERKTSAMERRLEKIKVKMDELYEKKLKNVGEKRAHCETDDSHAPHKFTKMQSGPMTKVISPNSRNI